MEGALHVTVAIAEHFTPEETAARLARIINAMFDGRHAIARADANVLRLGFGREELTYIFI